MSLSEQISELDRRISSSVQGVLSELRRSLQQSQSVIEDRLASLERSLPETFVEEEDLSRLASDAAAAARGGALNELREALAVIDRSPSQTEILRSLLHESRRFAPRSALLITESDLAKGWEAIGFPAQDQPISGLWVPYSTSAGWQELALGRGPVALSPTDCAVVASHLGVPIATEGVLIPIVLADCIAAALYSDRTSDSERFEIPALQVLAQAAAQTIESLSFRERGYTPTLRDLGEAGGVGLPLWSPENLPESAPAAASEPAVPEPIVLEPAALAPVAPEPAAAWEEPEPQTVPEPLPVEPPPAEEAAPEIAEAATVEEETGSLELEPEPAMPAAWAPPPAAEEVAPASSFGAAAWASDVPLPGEEEIGLEVEPYRLAEEPASLEPASEPWTLRAAPLEPIQLEEPTDAWDRTAAELFEPTSLPSPAFPVEIEPEALPIEEVPAPTLEVEASEPAIASSSETYELPIASLSASTAAPATAPAEPVWPEEPPSPPVGLATTMISGLDVNEDATILIPRKKMPSLAPPEPPAASPPKPVGGEEEDETLHGRQSLGGLRQLGLPRTGTTAEVAPPRGFEGPGLAFVQGRPSSGDNAMHEAAHRLARLLVNEIKLYNEEQVLEGRRQRDIYNRLRDEIERSRKMFEQQTSAEVRASRDFFTDELVRQLADGDRGALGQ